jgi:hypothetical protein
VRSSTVTADADHLPVLTALGKPESALATVAAASEARAEIAARLEVMARDFRSRITDSPAADTGIDAAGDDALFDLIDQELGVS